MTRGVAEISRLGVALRGLNPLPLPDSPEWVTWF